MAGRAGKVALGAALVAAGVAAVRALRGGPAPAFSEHPSTGTAPMPTPAPTPVAQPTPEPARTESTPVTAAAPKAEPEAAAPDAAAPWVEPVDGACPEGFPVKAKLSSGIFHVPGGLAYERTKPDRCYRSADDALADGLRAAKR
jgi:hypothetical protein